MHLSFHTILILAYTIPNIYVFLRILKLFISKDIRVWYVIIYFLIASIYPVSNSMPEGGALTTVLEYVSGYLLPFYLYLFLSLLIFDLLILINRLFKIVPREKLKSSAFRKISLGAILFVSLATVIGGIINFNTIRTSEYRIEIPAKGSALKHLRIAFIADFHLQERTGIHFVRRFAEKIKAIEPDIIIFGGDIVEGDKDDGNVKEHESILKGIHTKYGIYSVLGNHEYYAGQDKGSFFDKAGMRVLCDNLVVFDSSFTLAGRYDSHFGQRESVSDLLSSASDSLPLILVDHRPTEIDEVSRTKADIQLSGHTHDGQMFPINLITRRVYQLSWGHMKKENTHFFVTSGIRLWGPQVRTTGKSEIMVIDVDFAGK
jgi:predicted MPP superfamily phosphohydrolase